MKAITKVLAGGIGLAALAAAAPAAAQYYPGYGYGYPGYSDPGAVVGAIIDGVTGGYGSYGYGNQGYGNYGYGVNSQFAVNQCANAVQARLGGYGGYGYGGGRVLGISRVEQGLAGALNVHGVATSGRYGAYMSRSGVDLTWKCRVDQRGAILGVDVRPIQVNYGYQYTPWNYDYSQYGYTRY